MKKLIKKKQKKTNNHLSPLLTEHKRTMTYDICKPDPGLGQMQKIACSTIILVVD